MGNITHKTGILFQILLLKQLTGAVFLFPGTVPVKPSPSDIRSNSVIAMKIKVVTFAAILSHLNLPNC